MDIKNNLLLPDFLVIGAGKCGTTSLDKYLRQHPQIYIPPVKEPNFFGYELFTEDDLRETPGEITHYRNSVTNLDDYQKLFENAKEGQIKGETSNTYLYHESAPERIKHYNPDIKLVAIFRQPAERLWSRFMHLMREDRLPTPDFSDCLDRSSVWWHRNDLIKEGFYYQNISKFYELFPADQIKVCLFEDLRKSGQCLLRDIFKFLEVDHTFYVEDLIPFNQSGMIKNRSLDHVIGNHGVLPKMAKYMFGRHYEALKENPRLQSLVVKVRKKNLIKPKMDPEIKKILTREVYREDIRQLESLIKRDLSHWLI